MATIKTNLEDGIKVRAKWPRCVLQRVEETIEETLVKYSCMKVAGYCACFEVVRSRVDFHDGSAILNALSSLYPQKRMKQK